MIQTTANTPVIPGFFSDPTICRVGDDYYLATSSFEYFPGAPIMHSRDLVTWTQIGNILTTREQFHRGAGGASQGIYGSTLRHHDGKFWFITTNFSDFDSGQLLVWSDDPSGPWSEGVRIPWATGIDPDICWDDEGCLLTWRSVDFATGSDELRQARFEPFTGERLSEPVAVWQGSGMDNAEGPHLYRIGEYWYQLLAEGGTERGHAVTIARAPSPSGPWEAHPANPVLTHRSSLDPVQNIGHADLVQTADGSWAAVFLGVRPRGSTPGFHVLGRETFLARVGWQNGWPVFLEGGDVVPPADTSFVDDFSAPALAPRWVVPSGEFAAIAETAADGGLSFLGEGGPDDLLCTRLQDLEWTVDADVTGAGRLVVRIDGRHEYGVELRAGELRATARIGDLDVVIGSVAAAGSSATLRLQSIPPDDEPVPRGQAGPDVIVLSAVVDGDTHEFARLDGRYLSTEVASGFTGRMLGVGAAGPHSRLREIRYNGDGGPVPARY